MSNSFILIMLFRIANVNKYDGIDERIVLNVKVYAKRLKRNKALYFVDVEDLEQDLMYEVLLCIKQFDGRYGELEHFVRKVLNRRSANLLNTYTCKKRNSVINSLEYCDNISNQYENDLEKYIELLHCINKMPMKYRLLCKLVLSNYSFIEIANITGVSRSTIARNLQCITRMFQRLKNSRKLYCFFTNSGDKHMSKNMATIEELTTKELSDLEIYDLADLSEQVSKLVSHVKELKEKLEDALNLRFSEKVRSNLQNENRDTGTTKFIENGFQITAEVPKKVIWDSKKIEEIIGNIAEEKRQAIIKTTYVIDERKYQQLSPEDKQLFVDARTVTPGKAKFKISIPEEV